MSGNDTIEFIRRGIQRAPLVTLSLTFTLLAFWVTLHTDPESALLTQQVIERWGNTYLRVSQGELWRLFTYAFIHATPSHLVFNLIGILILGTRVERLIGHIGLMSLFLGAASLGGLLSFFWRDYELSIGASGALYGLLGAELVFMSGLKRAADVLMERRLNVGFVLSSMWLLLGLFMGLLNELNSEFSSVDTATHLASFVSGGLLGWVLLWARSYRLSQGSLRGILSAMSPLFMSLLCLGGAVLFRPSPPGFGGFVSRLATQELSWRQQQEALSRLSPAERREMWERSLTPPLTEMTLELDELIEHRLASQGSAHQLAYARTLSRYLNLWLEGARALSQEPLDPFAPPLAQLREELYQSKGRVALMLASRHREQLARFREPELLNSKLPIAGLNSSELHHAGQARSLSELVSIRTGDEGADWSVALERLSLLDWIALIRLTQPRLGADRKLAARSLSACLLSRIQRENTAIDEPSALSIQRETRQDHSKWTRCQQAQPEHVVYGSLMLAQLNTQNQGGETARWLRFALDLLTRLLDELDLERESWSSPPTRLELDETLLVAQNQSQLYTLWSQLAAQSLNDLLEDQVAEPLRRVNERWETLTAEESRREQTWRGPPPKVHLSWAEPLTFHEGRSLMISALAPGPEGLLLGVYQEVSGQLWLIEVPIPARQTTQTLLIPASCDVVCATRRPTLFSRGYDELEERELEEREEGRWVGQYHLTGGRQSSLPVMTLTARDSEEDEEPVGWRAWPLGSLIGAR